jgi:hypothetical protein
MNKINLDYIKDLSLAIVDKMVEQGLIKNCIDTDDMDEFEAQDIIREVLCDKFNIEND